MTNFEKFAIFGFQLDVPSGWFIEFNRKMSREKGEITFVDQGGDSLAVHWGQTADALKRFPSLKDQRDFSINQIRRGSNVLKVEILEDTEKETPEEEILITNVKVVLKEGKWTKGSLIRYVFSEHIRCKRLERYYVVYAYSQRIEEIPHFRQIFDHVSQSFQSSTLIDYN